MRIIYETLIWLMFFYFSIASSCFAGEKSYAVWSIQEQSNINIFYSVLTNAHWSEPIRITTEGSNVTPAITVDSDGAIWVVWVDFMNENRLLKYALIKDGDIVQGRVLCSLWERSYSPSIIVDRSNKAWLVWAGYTGMDEDIFFSQWNGSAWDAPKQVNPDNNFPDSTPTIGLGVDGRPWVSWFGFNDDKDDTYIAHWSGKHWDTEQRISLKNNVQQKIKGLKVKIPQLPAQAKNRLMGAVFLSNGEEIQSISDRLLSLPLESE